MSTQAALPMTRHHHLAIAATVILNQALAYLWYSPVLFLSPWLHALGTDISRMTHLTPLIIGASVAASVAAAYALSWLTQALRLETFRQGVGLGSLVGLGIAAPALCVREAFAGLPWTAAIIDALYVLVTLALTGGLLAVWRRPSGGADAA